MASQRHRIRKRLLAPGENLIGQLECHLPGYGPWSACIHSDGACPLLERCGLRETDKLRGCILQSMVTGTVGLDGVCGVMSRSCRFIVPSKDWHGAPDLPPAQLLVVFPLEVILFLAHRVRQIQACLLTSVCHQPRRRNLWEAGSSRPFQKKGTDRALLLRVYQAYAASS